MGTLGCINDMLRRDKENRELRRAGRERMNNTRNRLIDLGKKGPRPTISVEQLEDIRQKTQEKEDLEKNKLFRIKLTMLSIIVVIGLLAWLLFACFF